MGERMRVRGWGRGGRCVGRRRRRRGSRGWLRRRGGYRGFWRGLLGVALVYVVLGEARIWIQVRLAAQLKILTVLHEM